MEQLRFLTEEQVREIQRRFGTPTFVYDESTLRQRASEVLGLPNPFGLTARYAMKALPTGAILRLFDSLGLHIDASSGYEAQRAMMSGIPGPHIQITAQELPANLPSLLEQGVLFNACSLHQLRVYGGLRPGSEVSIRLNPGLGSGHSNRTNVGGPSASFGIWHEYLDDALEIAQSHKLRVSRLHTHVGSGADPVVWNRCAQLTLGLAERLPDVQRVSLGGGFKVGRMQHEESADLQAIGEVIKRDLESFESRTGRALHLEIEPGTYLVANAGALVSTIIDVVDTGERGHRFLKVDSGMTEVVRPAMYGAQHPLVVVPVMPGERATHDYLVAGHCCESGDVLTPEPGNPEGLQPRTLLEVQIGDALVVGGAGAYCAAMSPKNYNSFPEAAEVLLDTDGNFQPIRKRQALEQIVQNEL